MLDTWYLLAQAPRPPKLGEWDPRVFWSMLLLIAALLVGAAVLAVVDRWRKRARQEGQSAGDQMTNFRELYERGELSQEEYDRIRSVLGGRLREELQMPSSPEPSAGPVPPTPPTPPQSPA